MRLALATTLLAWIGSATAYYTFSCSHYDPDDGLTFDITDDCRRMHVVCDADTGLPIIPNLDGRCEKGCICLEKHYPKKPDPAHLDDSVSNSTPSASVETAASVGLVPKAAKVNNYQVDCGYYELTVFCTEWGYAACDDNGKIGKISVIPYFCADDCTCILPKSDFVKGGSTTHSPSGFKTITTSSTASLVETSIAQVETAASVKVVPKAAKTFDFKVDCAYDLTRPCTFWYQTTCDDDGNISTQVESCSRECTCVLPNGDFAKDHSATRSPSGFKTITTSHTVIRTETPTA
ncbi:hypothetical protein QBC35DRAFT_456141 [Podospora australis]|uniref:Uncharacterized protein n=1 Tax=Podospora australis TaxID=1536484 RepID=A0AAN6WLP9_9PEZI|nr:hypothetical protein QBC35DRAFT_456141 [Podospora australis]